MKKQIFAVLAAAAVFVPYTSADDNTRTIRLIQDDAQEKMTTKMYPIKNLKTSDIYGYVQQAALRYSAKSKVRSLNYKEQPTIIVTAPDEFIPYMDQIIATLDRGTKKNEFGSALVGTGVKWRTYSPKYRFTRDLGPVADLMLSGSGETYYDETTLWVKDDSADADFAFNWINYFDRPLPQATLTFKYYTLRESTLRDIGVDYLAWKNGPGMNLFDVAFDAGRIAWDRVFNTAASVGNSFSWTYGGFFTAPAFDLSFIRLLQQSGNAKVVAQATLTVKNDLPSATVSLSPDFNNQIKDENFASHVVKSDIIPDMTVSVTNPMICFLPEKSEITEEGWIPADKAFYDKNKGSVTFGYHVSSFEAVEANNNGLQIGSQFANLNWSKTIVCGKEQLLSHTIHEQDVEQTTGIPFLCNLPVLKYICGTTTTVKESIHCFVTVEAKLVHPDSVSDIAE